MKTTIGAGIIAVGVMLLLFDPAATVITLNDISALVGVLIMAIGFNTMVK